MKIKNEILSTNKGTIFQLFGSLPFFVSIISLFWVCLEFSWLSSTFRFSFSSTSGRSVIIFSTFRDLLEFNKQKRFISEYYFHVHLLPPTTKLRQANVFTPVCDSVRGGGVSVKEVSDLEVSVQRGLCPGSLCQGIGYLSIGGLFRETPVW